MTPTIHLSDDPSLLERLSRVRILYTDLDGTLLAPGGGVLGDNEAVPWLGLAEQIVALNKAGLTVVPVSGREVDQLFELTRLLGWTDFIAEAGAVTVRGMRPDAEFDYQRGAWPEEYFGPGQPTPFERIAASGAFEALVSAFPGRIEQYSAEDRHRHATHLLRGCIDVVQAQRVIEDLQPPMDLIDNGALRYAGTLDCSDAAPHAVHLVPRGISKAGAIAADLASRGLAPDQAAAIGDSATDIQMADAVATMVLVANALESPGVLSELERSPRENVRVTTAKRSEGWTEFARMWLEATQPW